MEQKSLRKRLMESGNSKICREALDSVARWGKGKLGDAVIRTARAWDKGGGHHELFEFDESLFGLVMGGTTTGAKRRWTVGQNTRKTRKWETGLGSESAEMK